MQHNFLLAKPYGLANQKLCYIPICNSWRKRQRILLRMVGEYGPWSYTSYVFYKIMTNTFAQYSISAPIVLHSLFLFYIIKS